jgi:hypothetical protein
VPREETVLDVQRSRLVLLGSLLGLLLTSWVIVALHRRRVRGETGQEVASKPDDVAADW